MTPWGINRRIDHLYEVAGGLGTRLTAAEDRLDAIEAAARAIQDEASALRDKRVGPVEQRVDDLEKAAREVSDETARLRDRVVPAAVARSDALLERLAEEIDEVGSLAERCIRREPLPTPGSDEDVETRISEALAEVQPLLLESFRGTEEEIRHRLDHYLPELKESAPVLDLGCGRGELLLMLREAGVASSGVNSSRSQARNDSSSNRSPFGRQTHSFRGEAKEGSLMRSQIISFVFANRCATTLRYRCWASMETGSK